jgi:hypothetical protein
MVRMPPDMNGLATYVTQQIEQDYGAGHPEPQQAAEGRRAQGPLGASTPAERSVPPQTGGEQNGPPLPGGARSRVTNFGEDPLIGEPVDKYQPCAAATGSLRVPEQVDLGGVPDMLISLPSTGWKSFFLFSKSGIDAYAIRYSDGVWNVLLVFQDDLVRREQLAKYLDLLNVPKGLIYLPPGMWFGRSGPSSGGTADWPAVADFKYATFSMEWVTETNPGQPSVLEERLYAPLACYSWTHSGQAPTSEIGMIAFPPPLPPVPPDSVLYMAAIDMNKIASMKN